MPAQSQDKSWNSSNWLQIVVLIIGLLISSSATYAAMSSRVAVLETQVESIQAEGTAKAIQLTGIQLDISAIKTDIAVIKATVTRSPTVMGSDR